MGNANVAEGFPLSPDQNYNVFLYNTYPPIDNSLGLLNVPKQEPASWDSTYVNEPDDPAALIGKKRPRENDEEEEEEVESGKSSLDISPSPEKLEELNMDSSNDDIEHKPNDDGYRWRKYGRKSVKGSKYPRSYYKCTYPNCQVKKQVEVIMKNNTLTVHTSTKGKHEHDPPLVTHVKATDQITFKKVVLEGFAKFDANNQYSPLVQANLPRLVVEANKGVNHLDDGYRWRKYGQKHVKGSKWPRSYYKCTETDCMVKKQVDQLEESIVNTYEGTHNHGPPCADGLKRKRRKSTHTPSPSWVGQMSRSNYNPGSTSSQHNSLSLDSQETPEYVMNAMPNLVHAQNHMGGSNFIPYGTDTLPPHQNMNVNAYLSQNTFHPAQMHISPSSLQMQHLAYMVPQSMPVNQGYGWGNAKGYDMSNGVTHYRYEDEVPELPYGCREQAPNDKY